MTHLVTPIRLLLINGPKADLARTRMYKYKGRAISRSRKNYGEKESFASPTISCFGYSKKRELNSKRAKKQMEILATILIMVCIIGLVFGATLVFDALISFWPKSVHIQACTRQFPHICKERGPCNGGPKE